MYRNGRDCRPLTKPPLGHQGISEAKGTEQYQYDAKHELAIIQFIFSGLATLVIYNKEYNMAAAIHRAR